MLSKPPTFQRTTPAKASSKMKASGSLAKDAGNGQIIVQEVAREIIEISGAWDFTIINNNGSSNTETYVFTQTTPITCWSINHKFKSFDIMVTVYDLQRIRHFPANIDFIDDENININFTEPVSGKAILLKA